MKKIFIYGAGGHAKVIAESIELCNNDIGGYIDDYSSVLPLLKYSVYRSVNDIDLEADDTLVFGIGSNSVRKKLNNQLTVKYCNVIHPGSIVSKYCRLGNGTVVMGGATINVDVKIGNHAIINTNASIDHDCVLEDYVHISPNAALAGNVKVGEGTHIGIGACVIQGVTIGKWCTIGAGAVVIKDIPDGSTVVGNPGKIIKTKSI